MKKVFLSLAVIASVSLFSCGGNKAEKDAVEEEVPEVVEEAVVDSAACQADSCCADSVAVVEEGAAVVE